MFLCVPVCRCFCVCTDVSVCAETDIEYEHVNSSAQCIVPLLFSLCNTMHSKRISKSGIQFFLKDAKDATSRTHCMGTSCLTLLFAVGPHYMPLDNIQRFTILTDQGP